MNRRAHPSFHHEASSSSDAINSDLLKAELEGRVRPSIRPADIAGKKYTNFWEHKPSCGLENFLPLYSQSITSRLMRMASAKSLFYQQLLLSPLRDKVARCLQGPLVPLISREEQIQDREAPLKRSW